MNNAIVQPYLFFHGRCQEALNFYQSAIGATVEMVMRFSDSPDPTPPGMLAEGFENKIMHACLRIGQTHVMASDGCDPDAGFKGFSLSLTCPTIADVDRTFAALSAGGKINMPLGKTFWSQRFGMLTDRFGIDWMVMVADPQ